MDNKFLFVKVVYICCYIGVSKHFRTSNMNKCPECENQLKTEDKITAEYYFCDKCGFGHLEYSYPRCCLFPNPIPVRYYSDEIEAMQNSDDYIIYNQCQNCGKKIGQQISKKKFDKNSIPQFDNSLLERTNEVSAELRELSKKLSERKIQNRRENYWDDYDEYLKSEKWMKIRDIVLERDNYKCQSCLDAQAEQVHHTDGRFRKNEPIFTLVSVCTRCHEIITEIERGNYRQAEKIKYKFDK